MKKYVNFLTLAVFLWISLTSIFPVPAAAANVFASAVAVNASGSVNETITWDIDADGVLTVSGEGAIRDYASEDSTPWWTYRGQIYKIVISDGITSIGNYAFYGLYKTTEVVIGNDVESIGILSFSNINYVTKLTVGTGLKTVGDRAFNGWVRLQELHISDLRAWCQVEFSSSPPTGWDDYVEKTCLYLNGEKVTQVVIPDGVTSVGRSLFSYDDITTITIPESVVKIGGWTFCGTETTEIRYEGTMEQWLAIERTAEIGKAGAKLYIDGQAVTNVVIPEGTQHIGDYAFANFGGIVSATMPETVTSVGAGAFWNSPITTITLSDRITAIGKEAFEGCTNLTAIVLPEDLKTIGENAFFSCTGLAQVVFSEGLEEIGNYAFYSCTALQSLELPEGLTRIGDRAFWGCSSLETAAFPDTLKTIGQYAFEGCSKISELCFPSGLETIGDYGFCGLTGLTRIVFEGGNYTIGSAAFFGCSSLSEVKLGEGLTKLSWNSFRDCTSLTEVTLPATLTEIEAYGLGGCTALRSIRFLGDAPVLKNYAFYNVSATCYYPANNDTYTQEYLAAHSGGSLIWQVEGYVAPDHCGDDITWELTEDYTLILTGTGAMYDYDVVNTNYPPWYGERENITAIQVSEGITYIGNQAFYGTNSASIVELPATLEGIGSKAFWQCGVTALELPDGLSTVGEYAFKRSGLKSVTIPGSLTDIPLGMFEDCYTLQDVVLNPGVKTIGAYTFSCCYELKDMVLPEGVVSIGEGAFEVCGCSSLYGEWYNTFQFTSIKLPSTLESIGRYAFNYCEALRNVEIPEKITVIQEGTFSRCKNLTNITIPSNIVSIENNAFGECTSLHTITFEWTAPTFADEIFYHVTATCYYPSNNPDWTADLLQNYDGTLTWVGQEMEKPSDGSGGGSGENAGEDEGDDSGESGGSGDNNTEGGDTGSDQKEIEITVNNGSAASGTSVMAPENGWTEGTNTFTVSGDTPCAVLVSYDGGATYTRLLATHTTEGYSFTAENMTSDTILTVMILGDANGDGSFTNADVTRIRAAYAGKIVLDAAQRLACDVNGDGSFTNADVTMVRAAYAGKTELKW